MGEGWHNNHHYYQRAARQGFYWWEIDLTFYVLKALEALGLVWDLHAPPLHVRESHKIGDGVGTSDPAALPPSRSR
jgi:stearoyl-CoA desaturase (delta-9 desaturase)